MTEDDPLLKAAIINAVMAACISPLTYDPQKLLPAPSPFNRPVHEFAGFLGDLILDGEAFFEAERRFKLAVIKISEMGFSHIEDRVIAAMGDKRVRGVILDIESPGGEIPPHIDILDHIKPKAEEVAKRQPPSYLRHDPTKRHSRRRKRK